MSWFQNKTECAVKTQIKGHCAKDSCNLKMSFGLRKDKKHSQWEVRNNEPKISSRSHHFLSYTELRTSNFQWSTNTFLFRPSVVVNDVVSPAKTTSLQPTKCRITMKGISRTRLSVQHLLTRWLHNSGCEGCQTESVRVGLRLHQQDEELWEVKNPAQMEMINWVRC